MPQLRLSPQAARPDARSRFQIIELLTASRDNAIARLVTLGDRADLKAVRQLRRYILHAVHCQIHAARQKCVLKFLDEHAFQSHLSDRRFLKLVARSLDYDEFGAHSLALFQLIANKIRLPERESATPRANSQDFHFSSPSSPKRSRSASIPASRC